MPTISYRADKYSQYTVKQPGTATTPQTLMKWSQRVHSRTTSSNHPNWKALMEAGKDCSTSLTGVRHSLKKSSGYYEVVHKTIPGFTGYMNGDVLYNHYHTETSSVDPSVVSQATSDAQIRFAKDYRKKTSQFQSGVFVGQLLQTVHGLARPAQGLRKGIDALYENMKRVFQGRRGRDPTRAVVRAVSDTWLEWVYGHRANIQDVDDASRAFRAMASGRCFDLIRIHGTGKAEATGPSGSRVTFSPHPGLPSGQQYATLSKDTWDECDVTLNGAWRNDNPSGEMPLPMMFGVGVLDILPTAWELIPWSFFADYFVNIGDVLDAWQMRFISFEWLNRTTRSCRTTRWSDLSSGDGAGSTYRPHAYGGHAVSKRYDVSRIPVSSSWQTGFTVKLPGFEHSGKWLNIAALLAMGIKPR